MVALPVAPRSGIVLKIRIPYGIKKNMAMPEIGPSTSIAQEQTAYLPSQWGPAIGFSASQNPAGRRGLILHFT
jgi:hypothetical protein